MQIIDETNTNPIKFLTGIELDTELLAAEAYLQEVDLLATRYARPYKQMHMSYALKAYTDSGVYESNKQDLYDLRRVIDPIISKLCAWYESKYRGKFMCVYSDVSTLKDRDAIEWHVDNYVFHSLAHRVHIPIQTGPGARMFWFNDGKIIVAELERFVPVEIDNLSFHSVENQSGKPRIHLMFDIMNQKVYDEYKKANPIGFKRIVSTVVNDHFQSKRENNV